MKNTLMKSRASKRANAEAAVKLVVFGVGDVNLALHIDHVYKVLNQISISGTGLNGMGIAHVGDRDVTVIDLHRRLFQSSVEQAPKSSYLMIVKNKQGELLGIPVTAVPTLMEVVQSSIRILPDTYRQADVFGLATHVAVVEQVEPPMTIFVLDIEQLLLAR